MSDTSADTVIKTIKEYFDLDTSAVTREQQNQLKKFLNSAPNTVLVIERSDDSPNQIQFLTRDSTQGSDDSAGSWSRNENTLVFVKCTKSSQNSANDVILNETETIARLRSLLDRCDGSASSLMHGLSELRRLAKTQAILDALKAERKDLVLKVNDWADKCADVSEIDVNNDIIDRISVLKAREGKLKAVLRVCDSLFKGIDKYLESKPTLEQIQRELSDESLRLFREWYQSVKDVKLDSNKQCIEIDTSSQVPKVTFDPRLVKIAADTSVLRCLGFTIPADILAVEGDAKKYGGYARELREIVNFYCSVADQILLSQRPMLIELAKRFTALLESRDRMSWNDDQNRLNSWLEELKKFSKHFGTENRVLRKQHQKVLLLIRPLFEIPLAKWRQHLNDVKTLIQEIDYRYENTVGWRRHWDHQLYKILEYHFNDTLIKADNLLSFGSNNKNSFSVRSDAAVAGDQLKVELCFTAGAVTYKPSIEELKAKIYGRIKTFLAMPERFEGFVALSGDNGANNKSLFYAIYLRNFNNFPILYERANDMIQELLQIRQQFIDWCSLYYLIRWQTTVEDSSETLDQFLKCDTLEDYKNNLILIKTKAQKFNKEFVDNEIVCRTGSFVINIVPIKTFIDWLLIEVDKLLARSLKERCEQEIKVIDEKCSELLDMTSRRPESITDLIKIDNLFKTQLNVIQTELNSRYTELEAKLSFLMKWSAKIAPDLTQVRTKFDEFERITETKDSLLDSYKDILKSRVDAEIGNTGAEIQTFVNRWNSMSAEVKESKEMIAELRTECDSLAQRCEELSLSCDYFSQQKPKSFELFTNIVEEVQEMDAKWNLIQEFEAGISKYVDMEWIVSRNKLNSIEAYITKWEDENQNIGAMLTNRIKEWRELLSILKTCRGECYVKDHWQQFIALIGLTIDYEKLKLSDLVQHRKQLVFSKDVIKELNIKASNEMSIRETFNELDLFATSAVLVLYEHKTSEGLDVKLIREWRSILNQVSECTLTLQTVKNAEFFTSDLIERSTLWESRLSQLDSILSLLNSVQRKWISLEPIYAKDDTGMFTDYTFTPASRDFQDIIRVIGKDPHVMRLLHIQGLESRLKSIDSTLNACQKKLQAFMEESRSRFPRFYFLADDDLLLILAGKVEVNQSTLLKKLFNNTVCKINLDSKLVVSVESPEGETVPLKRQVLIESDRGASGVESWLRNLEKELKSSLKELFFDCLSESETTVRTQMWELPSQLLSLVNWVLFTQKTENSIRRHTLAELKSDYEKELSSLTAQELEFESVLSIKVKSLILDNIHFLTVLEELTAQEVRDYEDWIWQKQLRFYANKRRTNGLLTVQMGNSSFEYSFEYLGCFGGSKLVHTPLTDNCYLTLTQAMEMGLGGNPYGPAGTGKTESVKALGQHLGRQVMVFNCDEAIDVKAMTRILVGLIKCGAWGCFDEFNRLQLDVLSALSSQIQAIQWAIKNKSKSVLLPEYGEVDINSFSAIFITLNPAGKQYGGRNRLPDNLKSLFLPMAMSVPDNEIISRVLLLAEGFEINKSRELGQKLTIWFELARDCMTHQRHYDWGLRAIKTCLEASGRALRSTEDRDEVLIVSNTLRKQIKSKLIEEDNNKFESLLVDVFGQKATADSTGSKNQLSDCVIKVLEEKQLIVEETQITKIVELEEQLRSRLGVVIVGQSGAGKSTLWKVLKNSRKLMDTNCNTTTVVINPKAVMRTQLLGYVDEETREWHDGLLTYKSREIARDESTNHFWLIFDGDIDPDWVEALNSVLDDNRILTLPSGERIDFDPKRCNLIFETTSLEFASPATISRLGVVCVNGIKNKELLSAGLTQMSVQLSIDELNRYVSGFEPKLWVSITRSLLAHISYAKEEDRDPIKGILRVQKTLSEFDVKFKQKSGKGLLIQTESVVKTLELVKPYIGSEANVVFIGNKGCGKNALAEHTVLSTEMVVKINCTPDTTSAQVVSALKASCTLITTGSSKVMKSQTNSQIIIYLKNLELLSADKWKTKSVIAFLTQLMAYRGMYDELTYDWIQLSKFQVVATCVHLKYLDTRLVSLMHVVDVEVPTIAETEAILLGRVANESTYSQTFVKAFSKTIREFQSYTEDKPIDSLRIGLEIIKAIDNYNEVNSSVLRYEFWRAFQSQMDSESNEQILESVLSSVFGAQDSNTVFVSLNATSKLTAQSTEQFSTQIKRTVNSWINETEIQDPVLAIIPETIALFAESNTFLKESDNKSIKGLVLLGNSGSGRKLAIRATSHAFGFDTVWSPKQAYTEKQLSAELNALIAGEDEGMDRKVVLIINEIDFQLISSLSEKIYAILCQTDFKCQIRVVLILNALNGSAELMWKRVCHVYHCQHWTKQSLLRLPQLIIPLIVSEEDFCDKFVKIYELFFNQLLSVRHESRKYIAFIHMFKHLFQLNLSAIERRSEHLTTGVAKLDDASSEVEKLKSEATEQKDLLANKRREADDALNLITNSMHASEDQKIELEDIRAKTERETQKLKVRKVEIDAELKQIEPVLMQAKTAVGSIRSESLAEIRSMRAPPEIIRDILEGVLRLMGVNDTSWVSMKSFLSRRGVKDEIMNFESRKITPDMRVKVETLLHNHSDSFEPSVAKRASVAAAPLAEWVKANVAFSRVLHKIKPLEEEQNRLESGLRSAQTRMNSLSNQLEGVETEVGALRNRLNQVTVEAAQIEVSLKQTNITLTQSEKLMNDLSGEFSRWKQQLKDIHQTISLLPMHSLIASAYIVFCSSEPSMETRRQLFHQCCQTVDTEEFDLNAFMNCSAEEDIFISVQSTHLTPLICDPARRLLSTKFETAEITDMRSRDWVKVMELSLRFGRTLIINDFTHIEYPLLPVLRNEIYGGTDARNWIFIGEKRVDYNNNFRLYLITQDIGSSNFKNPLFNLINLSPSGSGMSSTLLSLVIKCRRPELETRKQDIEKVKLKLESDLRDLESKLLSKLSESTGNILNNTELIRSLNELKKSALSAEQSLLESAKLSDDLNRERAEYESLAQFASQIYFLIRELVNLNPMYRFGVSEYESVFQESLNRFKDLTDSQLLQDLYNYVSRGLFTEDRVVFERFVRKRCAKQSSHLNTEDNINVREFIRAVYGSDNRVSLIMTAPGSDPSAELQQIATDLKVNNYTILSMGADIIGRAEQAIKSNDDSIEVLCLTNLHLVIGWLPVLTHLLMNNNYSNNKIKKFVILCTECCDEFPLSLLEMSVKYAYESAPGLQHQLKRLTLDSTVKSTPELQTLSYLHAICCERRHFVPHGWTKAYEFGFNDFRSASNVIQTVVTEKDRRLRLDFIRGLLGAVIYGGKLDTSVDHNILQSLINRWFSDRSDDKRIDTSNEISLLGLSRNVNTLRQTALEERLTKGLHVLEKATDSDKTDKEFERLKTLWKQLAPNQHFNDNSDPIPANGSPLEVYLRAELVESEKLIARIGNDLNTNSTDNELNRQLASNETPDLWLNLWPNGPQTTDAFLRCSAFMCKELRRGLDTSISQMEFNLLHLFQPNSLINALKQLASRRLAISVDQLKLYSAWGRQTLSAGTQSMRTTINGIVIEGALFNGQQLVDCTQDSPLQSEMPSLSLYFLSKDSRQPYDSSDVICLPLYANSGREAVVVHLDVPIERGSASHWVQCAASLVIKRHSNN